MQEVGCEVFTGRYLRVIVADMCRLERRYRAGPGSTGAASGRVR
jgi:hypothetical protein